jgi:CRISPR/Cas system CMR subunit Cmr6 (Cas7 group RAMP superfamily)
MLNTTEPIDKDNIILPRTFLSFMVGLPQHNSFDVGANVHFCWGTKYIPGTKLGIWVLHFEARIVCFFDIKLDINIHRKVYTK